MSYPPGRSLLPLDVASRDDVAPLPDLVRDEILHLLGARGPGLTAEVDEPLARLGVGHHLAHLGVQAIDQIARRAAARAEADERIDLITGHGLGHGWHIRQGLPALARGDSERPKLAGLDLA